MAKSGAWMIYKKKPSLSNRLVKPLWAIYLNKQTNKKYMILKVHVAIHVLCTWDEINK